MAKLTLKQFADWIGLSPESISLAKQIVEISDSDGAYTHLQDMGEEEAAEAVEAIWFEYGSLKDAINACKEDLGLMNESKKTKKVNLTEFKSIIKNIIKEEMIKENQIKIDKDVIKQSAINTLKRIGNQNTTNNQKHKEAVELYDKEENKDIIDKEIKKAIKERENGSKISNALIGTRIASKINVKYNKR